jgi:predicted dehydrogenase
MAADGAPTKLRGALVGCGFFAMNHLHAWSMIDNVEIVAIVDPDEERRRIAGDAFAIPEAARWQCAHEMLADGATKESLHFLDIATQVDSHHELVSLAASHSLPAICQKPFAATMEEGRAMVAAMEERSCTLMVHENWRWQPSIVELRDVVASGEIGTPFFTQITFRTPYNVYENQPYLAEVERFIIDDLGVHLLDTARTLMGEASSVFCRTQRVNPAIMGEDVATIVLQHDGVQEPGSSGAVAPVVGGGTTVVAASYAPTEAPFAFPQTAIRVVGSKGCVTLAEDFEMAVHVPGSASRCWRAAPAVEGWMDPQFAAIQGSVVNIQRHWCVRRTRTFSACAIFFLCYGKRPLAQTGLGP